MGTMIEIILTIAVIVLLCMILHISAEVMFFLGGAILSGIIFLTLAFMICLFLYCLFRLITSKPRKARFTEIKKTEKRKYSTAFYDIDGTEYFCLFPSEMGMKNIFYKKDKPCTVMLNVKKGYVFDRFAILDTILGLILSSISLVLFINEFKLML